MPGKAMKPMVVRLLVHSTKGSVMIERNAKIHASHSHRCNRLHAAAHNVRQQAIGRGGDLAGWRLSHLMRNAETDEQVTFSEREYGLWLNATPATLH
jgi:hypothetical protein